MALKTRYTNVGGQVAAVKTGGQRYFVEPDALGNVRGLVNQSGVRSQTYTYWPYGEVRTSTGSVSQPLQFCGTWGYCTESSSKQYVRARYYMQSIGRWQTADPLWPREMAYGYANQRPALSVDPSGRFSCKEGAQDCEKYQNEPGWYDGHEGLKKAIEAARAECPSYSQSVISAILYCLVARETRGAKDPWNAGSGPAGPCQIWPDKYKDITCKGLKYKGQDRNVLDHLKCCARLLCQCLNSKGGKLVEGCGTTGSGRHRKGQWQVINESGGGMEPHFKCCLKGHGWKSPSNIVPRRASV